MAQNQTPLSIVDNTDTQPQELSTVQHSQEVLEHPERAEYQTIPLENINYPLQGSNPKTLAMNVLDDLTATNGDRQVEVIYPQQNQALVTVIEKSSDGDSSQVIKYRVEMSVFGRSLLVSSPPIWQIVWVGSQIRTRTGNHTPEDNSKFKVPNSNLRITSTSFG
ncbi:MULTISPECIES: hypothetical protein [unclassified Anabaena]|uniref:hypothetical protein n=1 Tax=unclassified Anabaena TaxID=2619674 RepID=UPI0030DC90B7